MTEREINTCAENIINDIFGYAELHGSGFDYDEQTLRLLREVAERCDEHIADLAKRTSKVRRLEAQADTRQQEQQERQAA